MDAKLAADIAAAKAELAAARAELAALDAGKLPREPRPKRATRPARSARAARPAVHRPENGMTGGVEGYGGAAPVGTRTRTDMQPIVMKHVSPFDRPVDDRMPKRVSVTVYDDAKMQQGLTMTMMEREVDSLAADLPFGWTLITRPCK